MTDQSRRDAEVGEWWWYRSAWKKVTGGDGLFPNCPLKDKHERLARGCIVAFVGPNKVELESLSGAKRTVCVDQLRSPVLPSEWSKKDELRNSSMVSTRLVAEASHKWPNLMTKRDARAD